MENTIFKNIKVSDMKNQMCGLTHIQCQGAFYKWRFEPTEDNFVNLLQCIQKNEDPDLFTILCSIFTYIHSIYSIKQNSDNNSQEELSEVILYYCTYYYENIYKIFVNNWLTPIKGEQSSKYDRFLTKIQTFLNDQHIRNKIKNEIISDLPFYQNTNISSLCDLLFRITPLIIVLEYLSGISYYTDNNWSITDLINQKMYINKQVRGENLVSSPATRETFVKSLKTTSRKKSSDFQTHPLPGVFYNDPAYKIGCNCTCQTVFALSLSRILNKNKRYFGSLTNVLPDNFFGSICTFTKDSGHTFMTCRIDCNMPHFDDSNFVHIECTLGWLNEIKNIIQRFTRNNQINSILNVPDNDIIPVYVNILKMILSQSSSHSKKYSNHLAYVPSHNTYMNAIRSYLVSLHNNDNRRKQAWNKWSNLFEIDSPLFDMAPIFETRNAVELLKKCNIYLTKFPKSIYAWEAILKGLILLEKNTEQYDIWLMKTDEDNSLMDVISTWKFPENDKNNEEILTVYKKFFSHLYKKFCSRY